MFQNSELNLQLTVISKVDQLVSLGGAWLEVHRPVPSVRTGGRLILAAFLRVTLLQRVRISWARGLGGTLGDVGLL